MVDPGLILRLGDRASRGIVARGSMSQVIREFWRRARTIVYEMLCLLWALEQEESSRDWCP